MKTICSPIKAAIGIIGQQKRRENTVYRKTRHCAVLPCGEGKLLYHTLTGELVLLEEGESEDVCHDDLVKRWFLVPLNFDERKQADGVRQVARLLHKNTGERTSFTILTTTDCNARCFYCYEMGLRRYAMTTKTAQDIGNYIVHVCDRKKVNISWFGGEPLYNKEVIDIICWILRKHDVAYDAIMTSNGYYLDAETARRALTDWHVKTIQITLDGTEMVYNRTKAYIDCDAGSPFRRVMNNIESALDAGLEVAIRLNMDRSNVEDLFVLTDQIEKRIGHRPNLFGRAVLLKKFVGDIHAFASMKEATEYQTRLQAELDRLGTEREKKLIRNLNINQCMADNERCEVILPDGRIERCEHIREAEVVGSIYSEVRDAEKIEAWKETVYFPECMECELYPICVNLKKCEWQKDGCPETRRNNNRKNMYAAILAAYNQEKMSVGREQDEAETELFVGGSRW